MESNVIQILSDLSLVVETSEMQQMQNTSSEAIIGSNGVMQELMENIEDHIIDK